MAKIEALVGVPKGEMEELEQAALRMGSQFGISAKDAAGGLFFLKSAGLDTVTAIDALERSAMASAIGLGTMEELSNTATTAMSNFGIGTAQAFDDIAKAAQLAKADPAELASQLNRNSAVAALVGNSYEELAAVTALMTIQFGDAAMAGTGVGAMLNKVVKPSQMARDALDNIGLSVGDFRSMMSSDIPGALRTLDDAFTANGYTQADWVGQLFEDSRSIRTVAAILSAEGSEIERIFDGMGEAAGMVDEGWSVMAETGNVRLRKAIEGVKSALIQLADPLANAVVPVFELLANTLGGVIEVLSPVIALLGTLMNFAGTVIDIVLNIIPLPGPLKDLGVLGLILGGTSKGRLAMGAALNAITAHPAVATLVAMGYMLPKIMKAADEFSGTPRGVQTGEIGGSMGTLFGPVTKENQQQALDEFNFLRNRLIHENDSMLDEISMAYRGMDMSAFGAVVDKVRSHWVKPMIKAPYDVIGAFKEMPREVDLALKTLADLLAAQVTAQARWADNLDILRVLGYDAVAAELEAEFGPEYSATVERLLAEPLHATLNKMEEELEGFAGRTSILETLQDIFDVAGLDFSLFADLRTQLGMTEDAWLTFWAAANSGSTPALNPIRFDFPVLHSGGIVPGPKGADVPAILQAGERVLPVGHSGGGGGGNVYITVQGGMIAEREVREISRRGLIRLGSSGS
jgi:TP901 family phage tail tape measure protein